MSTGDDLLATYGPPVRLLMISMFAVLPLAAIGEAFRQSGVVLEVSAILTIMIGVWVGVHTYLSSIKQAIATVKLFIVALVCGAIFWRTVTWLSVYDVAELTFRESLAFHPELFLLHPTTVAPLVGGVWAVIGFLCRYIVGIERGERDHPTTRAALDDLRDLNIGPIGLGGLIGVGLGLGALCGAAYNALIADDTYTTIAVWLIMGLYLVYISMHEPPMEVKHVDG